VLTEFNRSVYATIEAKPEGEIQHRFPPTPTLTGGFLLVAHKPGRHLLLSSGGLTQGSKRDCQDSCVSRKSKSGKPEQFTAVGAACQVSE
jgi:hypothetical protein